MIVLGHIILSDDIAESEFVCNLSRCKGACCIEGDLGAPLEEDELPIIADVLEQVLPYLTDKAKSVLSEQGNYILDSDGEFSTPTVNGKECVYGFYQKDGTFKCGFEKAYEDGKINFRKPISCHLYPARVSKYDHYQAVNYHRWHICSDACTLGASLQVPVYKFLKEALIRKFGEQFYVDFEKAVQDKEKAEGL